MASLSAVAICNVALSNIGASLIHSFTDTTTEAVLCSMFYDTARKTALSEHPWNFAIRRAELAPDLATPSFGFKFQFTLPTDVLRVLEVIDDDGYKVEGKKVMTNSTTCQIRYVADVPDVAAWSQSFVNVMQAAMRKELVYPITHDDGQLKIAEQLYDKALRTAKSIDASEDTPERLTRRGSAFISVRG